MATEQFNVDPILNNPNPDLTSAIPKRQNRVRVGQLKRSRYGHGDGPMPNVFYH